MYEAARIEVDDSQSLDSICYVCLSRTRNTAPLGEYAGIFNRIMYFSVEDCQRVKVCWECLGVLNKIKVFETKCYIAQRILSTKWENHSPSKCLSTLVMTPVKIDVHFGKESNEANLGFKFDDKSRVYKKNNNSYENSENQVYYCAKHEETESVGDNTDNRSENECYQYITKKEVDVDYIDDDKLSESNLNNIEIHKNDVDIKTDAMHGKNKEEYESKTFNKSINGTVENKDIKSYLKNNSSQFKLRNKDNSVRRKGLRKKDLEDHFRIVSVKSQDVKQFKCKFKIDASELNLWREAERSTEFYVDKPFKCFNCICGFSTLKKKYGHDKKYHNTASDYICDVCSCRFNTKLHLSSHVFKHYQLHQCNLCQFRTVSRHALKWHLRRHKRLVNCVHCDACFSNVGLFYKHFKANHSVFICDHCGKRCRTKYTLEKHMRHHSEKNICLICNKVYASRNSLRNHSEMKHKETSSEMAYCVKCDKQFPNVPLYKRHVQSSKAHAAERDADRSKKQVSCPVCGNVYSRKTYMMNHYRHVHMNQSKHYCADCDRHFLNRTRYVEHRKYHHEGETKAKNKMCNICGRGFAANRTLVNHIRTHSGERPYECQYCDAKFTQKHGMLSHIKYIHMKSKRRGYQ